MSSSVGSPETQREILDAEYLASLDINMLKSLIKLHRNVNQLRASWKITSHEAACNHAVELKISANWLYISQAAQTALNLDIKAYEQQTSFENRNIDHFLMVEIANGKLRLPARFSQSAPENIPPESLQPETEVSAPSPEPQDREMFKVFLILVDERSTTVMPRAATLFIYGVHEDDGKYLVDTKELIEQLQSSSERVTGAARLSIGLTVDGIPLRSAFYVIREGADCVGIPDFPELHLGAAEASTGCKHTLTVYLDSLEPHGSKGNNKKLDTKRSASVLGSEDDEEYRQVTVKSNRSTPSFRAGSVARSGTAAERDSAQLEWLRGPSAYDNAISAAIRSKERLKQPRPTCALAIFCSYVYILGSITPGEDCDEVGRTQITNACLANFLSRTADWVGKAKTAGALQVVASHYPSVKAHLDGDMEDAYWGIKAWTEFLEAVVAKERKAQVEAELKGQTVSE
ncbi:hypothetical protein R3P38DRAFT_2847288 [Favolaschia claudopus]|uniref:Uncharacterized protein n=1 Tax=Favolaschia claudopus TaxID=2862362 RepID=A0AAW0DVI7_9AGAR